MEFSEGGPVLAQIQQQNPVLKPQTYLLSVFYFQLTIFMFVLTDLHKA